MTALELQPTRILTKGDSSAAFGEVSRGVPQGASSSPTVYNVYMDTYAERLVRELGDDVDVTMFADDVKLRARTTEGLQRGLDVSTNWATDAGMTWGTAKCHVLEPESCSTPGTYWLSGQRLQVCEAAEYLGVTLRGTRLDTEKNLSRITRAVTRLNLLRAAGIHRKYIPSADLVRVCRTYVYPLSLIHI